MKCPGCGADVPLELHEVGCTEVERWCRDRNLKFRARQRYTHGWSDPRNMSPEELNDEWRRRGGSTHEPPITNWKPQTKWEPQRFWVRTKEVVMWCYGYRYLILTIIVWTWVLWRLARR